MRYLRGLISTDVSVRFFPLLLAVVLTPAFMQTQYTCNSGNTRLASLELEASGVNRLVFDPALRVYDLWLAGGETQATVRAVSMDPLARVTWYVPDGAGMLASGTIGVGGGEVTIDLPPDGYALYIGVFPPERAVDTYIVNMNPVCPQGDACANGGLAGTCVSGTCVPAAFPCTEQGIRVAIATGGGPHTFDCDGPTVVPTEAEIIIDNDVALDGEDNLIVDAGGAHRVFSIPEGVTAELTGFTVTGGSTIEEGGGILNAGALTLASSTLTGNTADRGGGVHNLETGTLVVTDCNVFQNTAIRFAGGLNNAGHMDVIDSVVSGNEAGDGSGGISNWPEGAVMTLTRTNVAGNTTAGTGGGISNNGIAALNDTTVLGNYGGRAGGGIRSLYGELTMVDCEVSGNTVVETSGGGIWNDHGSSAMLQNTVVAFNSARWGAGITNGFGSPMMLVGTTVHGNTATDFGAGGISNADDTLTMINSTVSGNQSVGSGEAIQNANPDGIVNLFSSTVVGGTSERSVIDNRGSFTAANSIVQGECSALDIVSLGGNVESPGSTCGLNPGGTDQVDVHELALDLGPLQDNGGPTWTHALLPGSVAIDTIAEADCVDSDGSPLTTDQRGFARPMGSGCDAGAFELQQSDIDLPEGFAASVFYDGIPVPDGIVVVSNESLYVVNEVGPDGPFVVSAPRGGTYSIDDALSTIGPPLVSPDDLEAGAGEQLFIADGQAQTVFRLPQGGGEPIPFVTPATTGFEWFNPFGIEVVPTSFEGPSVDPGDLIVADNGYGRGGRLWAVNQETGLATVFVQGAVFEDGPLRAEFAPDGTLYVFENPGIDGVARIVTVASDGTVIPFVEEIPAGGALAVHPKNGDVYFVCETGELCRVVYGTNTPEPFASNVGRFQSLEFSPSGLSLFVGATGRDQVIEIRGDEQSWGVP